VDKISESGASILSGRGLEETKRRIMSAFEAIRQPLESLVAPVPAPQVVVVNAEETAARFHARVKRLSLAALEMSHISTGTGRDDVWEIAVPNQSAETLFKEALDE
jgi:hypothetical protein